MRSKLRQEAVTAPLQRCRASTRVTPTISRRSRDPARRCVALRPHLSARSTHRRAEPAAGVRSAVGHDPRRAGPARSPRAERALATQLGLPTIDLRTVRPTPEALAYVSEEMARRLRIVPFQVEDDALDVAIADGSNDSVHEALARFDIEARQHLPRPRPTMSITCLNTYYRVLSDSDDNVKQFWESAAAKQSQIEAVDRSNRRGPDRPGRQQDRHPGAARPRLRRAHRAGRRLRARAVPRRRCAQRGRRAAAARWARRSSAASRSWPT